MKFSFSPENWFNRNLDCASKPFGVLPTWAFQSESERERESLCGYKSWSLTSKRIFALMSGS